MEPASVDLLRRTVMAVHILLSGPDRTAFLDPVHVLVGGGTPLTAAEQEAIAQRLLAEGRHMIFLNASDDPTTGGLGAFQVVSPAREGVRWWNNCVPCDRVPCDGGPPGEASLVPLGQDCKGSFFSRGGALRYLAKRPANLVVDEAAGARRLAHIIASVTPPDYAGQRREDVPGGGLRCWQTQGFRVRAND